MDYSITLLYLMRLAIVLLTLLGLLSPAALAQPNLSNQDMNQPAQLIAPSPAFKIGVYPRPDDRDRQVGYGLGGDAVLVQEQVGSNTGILWNYVRFEKSPHLEGWVRGDYVRFQVEQNLELNRSPQQSDRQQRDHFDRVQHQSSHSNIWSHQEQNTNNQNRYGSWQSQTSPYRNQY